MAKKTKGSTKERRERRFIPQSTSGPVTVKVLGALGAALLGAGAWAQLGHGLMGLEEPPYPFAPWVVMGGAVLVGAAVWMGTSGEAVVRVGAGGIGVEKGDLRRMPWYGVEALTWDDNREALTLAGKDDLGRAFVITIMAKSQPQASAWVLKEARDRIPKLVEVPDQPRGVPKAAMDEGQMIVMDPVQVVGRRCMESKTPILYEPDARICAKCERVYHKAHVPAVCECGTSLAAMRSTTDSANAS